MIIIPEVINTMLMGLIFMVIVITIVRTLMLNMVHEYSGPNVQDAIIDEIELEVARLAEQHSQRNSALIEFHRQLLIAPPRPERKSSEPSVAHDDDNDVDLFGLRAELDQAKAQAEQARLEAEEKARLEEELKQQEAAALAEQMAQLEGDAAQSGARFALAACGHDHDLVPRRQHRLVFAEEIVEFRQITAFFRDFRIAPQRTPDQSHITAVSPRRLGNGFKPRDIAGKASDDNPFLDRGEQANEFVLHAALRPRMSGHG